MRARLFFLVVVSLVLPAGARASGHWYAAAAAPSAHTGMSNLWGGNFSGEKAVHNKSFTTLFVDLAAHAGAHETPTGTSTLTQYSVLGGVRYSFPRVKKPDPAKKEYWYALDLFAHPIVGAVWTKDAAANSTDGAFAAGFGGGADYLFTPSGGVRGQIDYVSFWSEGGREDFVRISIGIVFRFKHD